MKIGEITKLKLGVVNRILPATVPMRPRSAYILFMTENAKGESLVKVAEKWKVLGDAEKAKYFAQYGQQKVDYAEEKQVFKSSLTPTVFAAFSLHKNIIDRRIDSLCSLLNLVNAKNEQKIKPSKLMKQLAPYMKTSTFGIAPPSNLFTQFVTRLYKDASFANSQGVDILSLSVSDRFRQAALVWKGIPENEQKFEASDAKERKDKRQAFYTEVDRIKKELKDEIKENLIKSKAEERDAANIAKKKLMITRAKARDAVKLAKKVLMKKKARKHASGEKRRKTSKKSG